MTVPSFIIVRNMRQILRGIIFLTPIIRELPWKGSSWMGLILFSTINSMLISVNEYKFTLVYFKAACQANSNAGKK